MDGAPANGRAAQHLDADAALAAALQAEEAREAQLAGFQTSMNRDLQKALSCEDPAAHAAARAAAPFERLRAEARATCDLNRDLGEQLELGEMDVFVQGLLLWFKGSFMTWQGSTLPCSGCGGTAERDMGMLEPTPEERADGAGRVEGYRCEACGTVGRFPRYTNPRKLLTTRRGRCGEWAHTFLLLLRSAGLEARHIHDHADHVWVEYHSAKLGRWVHLDPCEAAFDTPLLYDQGWGKKLALVIAVGATGAADVTRRYVSDYEAAQQRRRESGELSTITDEILAAQINALNGRLRSSLPAEVKTTLLARDLAEALTLQMPKRPKAGQKQQQQNLPGRQSGPAEWRTARGEAGPGTTAATGSSHPPAAASRDAIRFGAAVRGSGANAGQAPAALFDGSPISKWLDFGGGGAGGQAWVEWRLPATAAPVPVCRYSLVSADDCPERDPAHILLECIPALDCDGDGTPGSGADGPWRVVDERKGLKFPGRGRLLSFEVPKASRAPARRWRLRLLAAADPVAANSMQLAVWDAYGTPPAAVEAGSSSSGGSTGAEGVSSSPGESNTKAKAPAPAVASAVASAVSSVPYLTPAVRAELRRLAPLSGPSASAANGALPAAAAAGQAADSDESADAEAARMLRRVASNLVTSPSDAKFYQLRADKVAPLLARPAAAAALFAMGFRPLLVPPRVAGGVGALEAGLVADSTDGAESGSDGRQAVGRAAAAVLAMLDDAASN